MKVILTSGGTAGHVFPAIVTAQEFQRQGHSVILCGVFKKHRDQIEPLGLPVIELDATGISFKDPLTFGKSLLAMGRAFLMARRILKVERPDAVVGFGAYGAFAVVLAAMSQGIPALIHEQNVRPGKANKLLSLFVKRIAVSFPESLAYFPKSRTVVTGYPCRPFHLDGKREAALETFGLKAGKKTILILGGSQGSHRINTCFLDCLGQLVSHFDTFDGAQTPPFRPGSRRVDFQVIHACGEADYILLQARYRQTGIPFYLVPFLRNMDQAYLLADLAICRAGAGTVSELAAFGVPAILIPYPYAGGHQKENAQVLVRCGAAVVLKEQELTPRLLAEEILAFEKKNVTRAELSRQTAGLYRKGAAEQLVRETKGMVRG